MGTALITGATAGIGKSFANQLAAQGYNLVLVARDRGRLEEIATALRKNVNVEVLAADLSLQNDLDLVVTRAAEDDIDLVINNAGFGIKQTFVDGTLEAERNLLDVLVGAVLQITHAVLPGQVTRNRGGVINVSSVAGWLTSGTYSAAKSWVTTFSEALATHLKKSEVHVMALCPGYTRTEFHQRADMETASVPKWMWLDVDAVVAKALSDFKKGKVVSVPGLQYRFLTFIVRYLPRWLVRRISVSSMRSK